VFKRAEVYGTYFRRTKSGFSTEKLLFMHLSAHFGKDYFKPAGWKNVSPSLARRNIKEY